MQRIDQVAIVGGTHGNEFTGIYLLRKWQAQPQLVARDSFDTELVFANPRAHRENRRYCDQDLNRQFRSVHLDDPGLTGYEQSRAKALNQQLGPKQSPRVDFVIDMHTTTSNMGPTVLFTQQGEIYRKLAGYLKLKMPEVTLFRDEDHKTRDDHHLLCTLGKCGVIVEVGPVPQAVLRQDIYEQSERLTQLILDFLQLYNQGALPALPERVEAYRYLESLTLPLDDNGRRIGMVHRQVQDNDFAAIETGAPLFQTFNGETIHYQGEKTVYPAFINEAAYYDNNLAMSLLEKVEIMV